MADTLSLLAVAAFIIAGISLAAAVFFWFFFKISSVIGDLSRKNAKRSIETMREAKGKVENKIYRGSSGEIHGMPEQTEKISRISGSINSDCIFRFNKNGSGEGILRIKNKKEDE